MTQNVFMEITTIMESQLSIYSELLGLAMLKPDILLRNDHDALSAQTKREEELVRQAATLEKERLMLMLQLPGKNAATDGVSLTQLVAIAPSAQGKRLQELGRQLANCIGKLKVQNTANRRQIEMNMSFTSYMLDLSTNRSRPSGIYSRSGAEMELEESGFSLLDSKA